MYHSCNSTSGVVRVAVSATPGKTKHFQTLVVSDSLLLCDCPGERSVFSSNTDAHAIMTLVLATGLVFPSFMRSAGEMLCAGILPYNQIMRDYTEPAAVIAARVPMYLLEVLFALSLLSLVSPTS